MHPILITILCALWLPIGLMGLGFVSFGTLPFLEISPLGLNDIFVNFVTPWIAGIPLTEAVRRLLAYSPTVAIVLAVILGLLTFPATMVAGLLGPLGVLAYALVLSIPAWVVWFVYYRRRRRTFEDMVSRRE